MNSDLLHAEHGPLLESAEVVTHLLSGLRHRLQAREDTFYAMHGDFAERCASLGNYLEAALRLVEVASYGPAFALLRVALEHQVFDELMFLADRYEQWYSGVRQIDFDEFQRSVEANGDALEWTYRGGNLHVVWRGLRVTDSDRTLSYYYGLWQNLDPFVGTRAEQAMLATGFTDVSIHEQMAERNARERSGRLRWEDLVRNLALNGRLQERDKSALQVHYRFLARMCIMQVRGRRDSSRGATGTRRRSTTITPPNWPFCMSRSWPVANYARSLRCVNVRRSWTSANGKTCSEPSISPRLGPRTFGFRPRVRLNTTACRRRMTEGL